MPYFSYRNLTFKWIKVVWCSRICTLISMSGSRAPQTPPSCFGVWRDGIRVRDSPRSFESEPELGTVWERRRQRLKKWLAIRQDQRKRHCQRGGHSGNVGGAAPSDGIRYDAAPSEAVIGDVTENGTDNISDNTSVQRASLEIGPDSVGDNASLEIGDIEPPDSVRSF